MVILLACQHANRVNVFSECAMAVADPRELRAELCHRINSPPAGSALYLSARRTRDPELPRYLAVADEEISPVGAPLRQAPVLCEACRPVPATPGPSRPEGVQTIVSRRAAA